MAVSTTMAFKGTATVSAAATSTRDDVISKDKVALVFTAEVYPWALPART